MIVAMQDVADEVQIQQVIEHLVKMGFEVHRSTGARQTVLGAVGAGIDFDIRNLELLPGVQEVHRISAPYKLAGKGFRPEGTIVKLAIASRLDSSNQLINLTLPVVVYAETTNILRHHSPLSFATELHKLWSRNNRKWRRFHSDIFVK